MDDISIATLIRGSKAFDREYLKNQIRFTEMLEEERKRQSEPTEEHPKPWVFLRYL